MLYLTDDKPQAANKAMAKRGVAR